MHVYSSHEKILDIASEIACQEGLSNVRWQGDFTALHLAAKDGSTDHVRQLLKHARASSVLRVLDRTNNLTPFEYASRDMWSKPIDLEMWDLLSPEYSEQALKSDSIKAAAGHRCSMG